MIRIALAGLGFFLLLHFCGFREHVGFLSGTVPGTAMTLVCGLSYATMWFFAVLVAPVLLLTGGARALLTRLQSPSTSQA
ncbi:MAG: hypothetical protein ACO1OB_20430 [Archangium sp.]